MKNKKKLNIVIVGLGNIGSYLYKYLKSNKFWASVTRIDEAFGDRNLICTCAPIEDYIES